MEILEKRIFRTISEQAEKLGVRAFVIGGFVRDYFLRRECNDIDVVVEGSGIALAEKLGEVLHTRVSVFRNFGTAMIKTKDRETGKYIEIEFVGARKESYRANSRKPIVEDGSLEDDQLRRDFTINALAFSLQKDNYGCLVDPFGGIMDLHSKIIRTPLDPDTTYSDDPLRMIRAIRFATQLDFRIVDESLESIKKNKDRLSILSKERIATELDKIMLSPKPSIGFRLLEETELLELILPQLHNLKGVETIEGKGHKDNFEHSLQVLDNVAQKSDDLWLRWAALLHDVGKAVTKKYEPGIGWTFHSHDYVGSKMVYTIFKQLKMPLNEKMKYVQKLVLLHLRPISLVDEGVTDSAIRRLLFDAGDDIDDLMTLCEADITSKNERLVRKHKSNFLLVRDKLKEVEEKDRIRNFKIPVDGELVMKTFNIPPCQFIGEVKEAIKNAILDGVIPNDFDAAFDMMVEIGKEKGYTLPEGFVRPQPQMQPDAEAGKTEETEKADTEAQA